MRSVIVLFVCLLLSGCKMGPDYKRPDFVAPTQWRQQPPTLQTLADVPWWGLFNDPVLTNLISEAVANNHDVRVATARIEEAMGGYHVQHSELFPDVSLNAGWVRARAFTGVGPRAVTANQYNLLGLLSYEIDFWGRLRRLSEAARANVFAAEDSQQTVYITLVANVARSYFDLLALDEQLAIAKRTVTSRLGSLELTKVKFNNGRGVVSELDVREAETQLYSAKATEADVERRRGLTENALSLLLGRNPGAIPRGPSLKEQQLTNAAPAGLPSDLLLRRPDIRSAEQLLIAANANIGAARAAYFPTISLTGVLGLQSSDLGDLFSSGTAGTWRFAPQVAAPIFNAGRIGGGVQIARSREEQALIEYQRSIQNAFREVEDALISIQKLSEQLDAQEKNVNAERARLELSELRYQGGVASYTEVLDAQRFLFSAELTLAEIRSARLSAVVDLYRALGGGWPNLPPESFNAATR